MSDPKPSASNGTRLTVTQWFVTTARDLTFQNLLILALLLCIAAPAFFAYRFLTDEEFRREFTTGGTIVDAHVPCLVLVGNIDGRNDRTTVANAYDIRDRIEYLITLRAPSLLGNAEIATACSKAHDETDLIRWAKREKEKQGPRPGPQ